MTIQNKKKLSGEATDEQIAKWKEEHGDIYAYECDGKIGYMRTVDRDTYSAAASKISTSPAKFNETVINKIWLGGDEDLRKKDCYWFGLIEFVEELMAKKKGSLTKL